MRSRKMTRLLLGLTLMVGMGVTSLGALPEPAQGEVLASCEGTGGVTKVSQRGPYDIGQTRVVELESKVDGTTIQVGIVRPDAPDSYKSPVIAVASPYLDSDLRDVDLRDCIPFLTSNYVQHGYTIAFVPTRGAGGTDSCADLMGVKERSDLDQAVSWLGTAPWSNGKVGMFGASYDGGTQWGVASTGNPHLKTIVPIAAVHNWFDLLFYRGRNDTRWPIIGPFYFHVFGHALTNPLTGREVDRYAGSFDCDNLDEAYLAAEESYRTGEYDQYGFWKERNLDDLIKSRYDGSVLLVQGLQDWNVDPDHQYPFVNQLKDHGIFVKQMIGQWEHELPDWGSGARGDFADVLLQWWDRWLKGDQTAKIGPRVEVQDSDLRWRSEETWPPRRDALTRTLFLSADGTMKQRPRPRTATVTLGPGTRNRYFYLNSQSWVYNELPIDRVCATCATFTYDVTREDLRVVGSPSLDLRLTPRGTSGHLSAYVFRVDRQDGWHLLGWGASDLRFPQGGYQAEPVAPGEPISMTLPIQPLDAVVHKGEQLMILLDQGHADHVPGVPFFPVDLKYGADLGTLSFLEGEPSRRQFFVPPPTPGV